MRECRDFWYWSGVKKRDMKPFRWNDIFDCVFKIDVFCVLLKEELPNKSTSEGLE